MGLARLVLAAILGVSVLTCLASAEDPASKQEQIRRIRQLPAEEKRHLKESLERFNSLPPAEREALRRKAREVGIDRLGELAGRDFEKLKRRHAHLQREMAEIAKLLGGPARLASLSDDERAFVRSEALRGFQRHLRVEMTKLAGFEGPLDQLPQTERRARIEKGVHAAIAKILDEKSAEDQARYRGLAAADQRREGSRLLAEWRLRETVNFARKFENFRLIPLLEAPPEKRRAMLAKRVRWFQLAALLTQDGVATDTMRMFGQLRSDEKAQVSQVYEQSQDLPVVDRRARVETKVRELYGSGSVDPARRERALPRFREILREPALRERREAPR